VLIRLNLEGRKESLCELITFADHFLFPHFHTL
jgi:hypothetical protein